MYIIFIRYLLSFSFCSFICNTYAINIEDATIVKEEAALLACQATGNALFTSCVVTPPNPHNLGVCLGLKFSYHMCVSHLNSISDTIPNFTLDPPDIPDPYSASPFSPCFAAISSLILPELCGIKPIS